MCRPRIEIPIRQCDGGSCLLAPMTTGTHTQQGERLDRPPSRQARSAPLSPRLAEGQPGAGHGRARLRAVVAVLLAAMLPIGWLYLDVSAPSTSSRDTSLGPISGFALPSGQGLDDGSPPAGGPPRSSDGERAHEHDAPDGLGTDEGAVPAGTSVFDDDLPAITRLDPDLLDAVRRAAERAEWDGVRFEVNSGWRSPAYQAQLLEEAIAAHGSAEAAARWVATPSTSSHVSGDAIDIGPPRAAAWLARNGDVFGLCQTYENEPWHFELRPDAAVNGCPVPYEDPTHDARLQGR